MYYVRVKEQGSSTEQDVPVWCGGQVEEGMGVVQGELSEVGAVGGQNSRRKGG